MTDHEKNEEKSQETSKDSAQNKDSDIFSTRETKIEEMAIDGICGVY